MAVARELRDAISRALEPVKNRLANSIARAVIERIDDTKKMQLVQLGVLDGEPVDDGERFQNYGFSSIPLPGAEAVVVFPDGERGHPLVIGVDDRRHRPTGGTAGEVVMYTDEGDEIRLGRGNIAIMKSNDVRLGSSAASEFVAWKSDLASLKSIFNAWVVAPTDGGGALKTLLASWAPTGATKVKAE